MQECEWKLHEEGAKTEEQVKLIRGNEYQGEERQREEQEQAADYEEGTKCVIVLFLDNLGLFNHSAQLGRCLWYETFHFLSANQTLTFNVILGRHAVKTSFGVITWSKQVLDSTEYGGGDLGFWFEVSHGVHYYYWFKC